jgi:electron transfer flavoprotein-quinone oxidoreductase
VPEKFDVIVVGAGPAGSAAAYTCAKAGLSTLLIERGEFPGAKNVFGGVLYRKQLDDILPGAWKEKDFPVERVITEQRYWLMGEQSVVSIGHKNERYNGEEPNCWTAFRVKFDQWFANKAVEAGAIPIYETVVLDVLWDSEGNVIGVKTDREDGDVLANIVIICDGAAGLLGEKLGAHKKWKPEEMSLTVKEVIALPKEKIMDRFNLEGNEGTTIEFLGTTSAGMAGMGFLYTNIDTISLGIGVLISDLKKKAITPYQLLEQVKEHPMIRRLIQGGERKEYSGHMIPEGALKSWPKLSGGGWMICGDAAQMVNFVHRQGSNLAMLSGKIAGETAIAAHQKGRFDSFMLRTYDQAIQESVIYKDIKQIQHAPEVLHSVDPKLLFRDMAQAINDAAYDWFLVDGRPHHEKEREAIRNLIRTAGGPWNALKLARKGWRAING